MKPHQNPVVSVLRGIAPYAIPLISILISIDSAFAGTAGDCSSSAYKTGCNDVTKADEFDPAGKKGDAWLRGSYGRTIAVYSSLFGLGLSGFTKDLKWSLYGVGLAAVALIVPPVIGGFFTAVV